MTDSSEERITRLEAEVAELERQRAHHHTAIAALNEAIKRVAGAQNALASAVELINKVLGGGPAARRDTN